MGNCHDVHRYAPMTTAVYGQGSRWHNGTLSLAQNCDSKFTVAVTAISLWLSHVVAYVLTAIHISLWDGKISEKEQEFTELHGIVSENFTYMKCGKYDSST